jgi:UDP-N-acetylmuramoyl-L-alanyl-D-glutamate--2,6-diaminopimelate ligase
MKLTQFLARAGVPVEFVRGDVDVTSVVADSRQCGAGACFIAVRGPQADGHAFIASALAAGASAVVCEDASAVPAGVPCAVLRDTARALGPLAQAMLDWPARKLVNIGVTGTKGKSTITYLVRAMLAAAGHKAALVGTISYETGSRSIVANNTTPGPVELASMMAEMLAAGNTHLVMEVSSHALDQGRVAGVDYAAAVFTNLTGEHLDYHKTMDRYLAAKRILFEDLKPGAVAVVNIDDPAGAAMADAARKVGARVITYGIDNPCDLRGRIEHGSEKGTQLTLIRAKGTGSDCGCLQSVPVPFAQAPRNGAASPASEKGTDTDFGKSESVPFCETKVFLPLIGRHNVYNALAAAGACAGLGVDWAIITRQLSETVSVPGRLERVAVAAPYEVFVDYAHTDDAMKNVLSAVRPMTRGKLIALFGCGGDRDPFKRPRMARVAEELADLVVITSDNPRTEKPEAIIEQIVAGLSPQGRSKVRVEPNRRDAIRLAISLAEGGDVVVLAGKGHEDYQIIGKQKFHFDDVEEAAAAMQERAK